MHEQIQKFLTEADELTDEVFVDRWNLKVFEFLRNAKGEDVSSYFWSIGDGRNRFDALAQRVGYLDALLVDEAESKRVAPGVNERIVSGSNTKVFIVHGHDNEAKEIVCRFIEKIGLEAIVLHEQANEGQTIVEKFEKHSDVAFALVLLTPDDMGESASKIDSLQFRARQNVVLELGYFMGALSRKRVCALHKGGVEIPSDIHGVLYVSMDDAGAWKNKIAQELVECQLKIDLAGLL